MMTFEEFKNNKLVLEFNGPLGQPDPSGISKPLLMPRLPMPADPTMGTQPGMSMKQPTIDHYDQFMTWIDKMSLEETMLIVKQLRHDIPKIIQSKKQ